MTRGSCSWGRQSLVYDDERILGGLDWNVAGRYHDALKIGYRHGGHQLDGIFAFNQNDETLIGGTYYDSSKTKLYKNMQTLWYHYDFASAPVKLSVLAMNLGQEGGDAETRKSDTQYMQTMGTYVQFTPGLMESVRVFLLSDRKECIRTQGFCFHGKCAGFVFYQ